MDMDIWTDVEIWIYMDIWTHRTTFYEVLKLWRYNIHFSIHYPVFVINFVLPILFVLTLVSDRAVLYENDAFSFVVLSTKKRYSRFF